MSEGPDPGTPEPVNARPEPVNPAATLRCHCPGVTVSAKPVAGLGDQATEAFVTAGPDADFTKAPNASEPGTSLLVLSSNAVISLYLDTTVAATGGSRASPPSSDQLAGMIAMARDGLAALADPASAPILRGPRYAQPRDPCQLIRASTRSRYAAGVTGQSDDRSCTWFPADGDLFLDVSTYDSLDEAESSYRFNLQFAHQDPGVKFRGSRPVRNVGAQATAIFLTSPTGNPGVELEVWSGNAVVQMTFDGDPVLAPAPSQATMLAAGIAMARDVLAGLRRT